MNGEQLNRRTLAQIRFIVDQFHVTVTTAEVRADMRRRLEGQDPELSAKAVRYAVARHLDNRKTVQP